MVYDTRSQEEKQTEALQTIEEQSLFVASTLKDIRDLLTTAVEQNREQAHRLKNIQWHIQLIAGVVVIVAVAFLYSQRLLFWQ